MDAINIVGYCKIVGWNWVFILVMFYFILILLINNSKAYIFENMKLIVTYLNKNTRFLPSNIKWLVRDSFCRTVNPCDILKCYFCLKASM